MGLLDEVIETHGGIDRWARIRRFTVHASIDGALFARKGQAGSVKDVVLTGDTRQQRLCITGFTAPDRRAFYQPNRVAIESLDGVTLQQRIDPAASFCIHTDSTRWDDLHLAYVCGLPPGTTSPRRFCSGDPAFRSRSLGHGKRPARHGAASGWCFRPTWQPTARSRPSTSTPTSCSAAWTFRRSLPEVHLSRSTPTRISRFPGSFCRRCGGRCGSAATVAWSPVPPSLTSRYSIPCSNDPASAQLAQQLLRG